jgi:hypothetical protein
VATAEEDKPKILFSAIEPEVRKELNGLLVVSVDHFFKKKIRL